MTKATGERLWLASNRYSAGIGTEFVGVRYGNVWNSNGSVVRKWIASNGDGITVTDPECTRFHLRLPEALSLVLSVLRGGKPGSLYVPVIPSYRLRDLVDAFSGLSDYKTVGLQPGEKLHESMVNEHEAVHAVMEEGRIRIDPTLQGSGVTEYNSGRNEWRLTVDQLREEIKWLSQS